MNKVKELTHMTTYWIIHHRPDLTEGRGHMNRTYLQVQSTGLNETDIRTKLEDFALERFGDKERYVQGVAPIEGWILADITKDRYQRAQPQKWGGRKTKTMKLTLEATPDKIEILEEEEKDLTTEQTWFSKYV